jgi:hypothetical protein
VSNAIQVSGDGCWTPLLRGCTSFTGDSLHELDAHRVDTLLDLDLVNDARSRGEDADRPAPLEPGQADVLRIGDPAIDMEGRDEITLRDVGSPHRRPLQLSVTNEDLLGTLEQRPEGIRVEGDEGQEPVQDDNDERPGEGRDERCGPVDARAKTDPMITPKITSDAALCPRNRRSPMRMITTAAM